MRSNRLGKRVLMLLLVLTMVIGTISANLLNVYADTDELEKGDTVIYTGRPQNSYGNPCTITIKNVAVIKKSPQGNVASSNNTAVTKYNVVLDSRTPLNDMFALEVAALPGNTSFVTECDGAGDYQLDNGMVTADVEMRLKRTSGAAYATGTRKWSIDIWVDGTIQQNITLPEDERFTVVPTSGKTKVNKLDSYSFTVDIKEGFKKNGTKFAVKANGTKLSADGDGVYTINDVVEDQEITVDGIIPQDQDVTFDVSLPSGTGYTAAPCEGYTSPVVEGHDYKFRVDIAENYKKGTSFAVKDNGNTLEGEEDVYTLSNMNDDHTITVTGVEPIMYSITLPTGTGYKAVAISGSQTPTQQATSYSFSVRALQGYKKGSDFAVKANGESITPVAGDKYTFTDIREDKIVTVEGIEEDESDPVNVLPINFTTDKGAIDSVRITDSNDCVIEGATYEVVEGSTAGNYTVNVKLPNCFDPKASMKAVFSRTKDSNDCPYVTDKTSWAGTTGSQIYGGRSDTFTTALSSGSATKNVYIYNDSARNSARQGTITIHYDINNKIPKRIDGVPESVEEEMIAGDTYSVDLSTIFTDEDGEDITYKVKANGAAAVAAEKNYRFTTDQMGSYSFVFLANDGKKDSEDTYSVTLTVKRKPGTWYITHTNGTGYSTQPVDGYSSPVNEGDDYKIKLNITKGYQRSSDFAVKANDTVLSEDQAGSNIFTAPNVSDDLEITVVGIVEVKPTITAPSGSKISVGYQDGYFKKIWIDPVDVETLSDGRVRNTYNAVSNSNLFYRIQNPHGVTYYRYITALALGDAIDVPESKLFINDSSFTKTTTRDKSGNIADVYLPINCEGYINVNQGATSTMNCFRNWLPVNSTINNDKEGIPDFHYEVVDESGNPSDLVTIEPNSYNSGVATLTASDEKTGMAIVKVTYDAMYIDDTRAYGPKFGAIWPERTGVFVVTVGQNGTEINTNMKIEQFDGTTRQLDAEHDPLFYVGNEGAEYSFTPETGTTVTVARPTVGDTTLTYNGFTSDGVSTDGEGKVTITGLVAGRNIIKVEKDDVAAYQVITARQISYTLKSGSTVLGENDKVNPGDAITVTYSDLTSPSEKFSGKYNYNFRVGLNGENGTKFSEVSPGGYGVYDFTTKDHSLTVTVPADWSEGKYNLVSGGIIKGGFAGGDATHRTSSYGAGGGMAWGTENVGASSYGGFPGITLNVQQPPALAEGVDSSVDKTVLETSTFDVDLSKVFADPNGDDLTYKVAIDGADAVEADEGFSYSPADNNKKAGDTVKLVFTANDGTVDSDETYTVNLLIKASAKVDFTSQTSGGFLHAPKFDYEVAGDLAESYGYTDQVEGVSVLDVLVAAHELVYGDGFTAETAEEYLTMSGNSPTKQFGISPKEDYTFYGGFFVNHALANDGTMYDDDNWTGSLVGTQEVKNGDLVEFFFFEDPYWGDTYNWFLDEDGNYSRSFNACKDADLKLNLKGFFGMQASLFKDEEEMTSSDQAFDVADAQLYTVNLDTGALTEIEDAVTDDDGEVTLKFDESGTYTIAAYGTEDCMFTQLLSLTTITVKEHDWGAPDEWIWEDDFSAAKAKVTCQSDPSHTTELPATVTSVKDGEGNRVFTAKVKIGNDTYTDEKSRPIEKTSAEVDFTSQTSGGFLHAPKFGYEVSSDLAEKYGYTDETDGVSVLDVLVAAHELVYGDSFTAETAEEYLTMSGNSPTKQFGISPKEDYTFYGGFFVNHALANDGTMYDDDNWTGSLVGTQEVKDGDLVEFFFFEDPYWGDTYNWFLDEDGNYSRSFSVCEDTDLKLNLKGFFGMQASLFKDEEEMTSSDQALDVADAQLYTVNLDTGALTEIEDAVTDDDGEVTLKFDEPGTYTIAAYGTEDCMFTQLLSLTTITVKEHNWAWKVTTVPTLEEEGLKERTCSVCGEHEEATVPKLTEATVNVRLNAEAGKPAKLYKDLYVRSDMAYNAGFEDFDDISTLSQADAIVAAHIEEYGDSFKADTTGQVLDAQFVVQKMSYGDMEYPWVAKVFNSTKGSSFWLNNDFSMTAGPFDLEIDNNDLVSVELYESEDFSDGYVYTDELSYTNDDDGYVYAYVYGMLYDAETWSYYPDGLSDTIIAIKDAEGNTVDEVETDEDGYIEFRPDKVGTYTLEVISTPLDYPWIPPIAELTVSENVHTIAVAKAEAETDLEQYAEDRVELADEYKLEAVVTKALRAIAKAEAEEDVAAIVSEAKAKMDALVDEKAAADQATADQETLDQVKAEAIKAINDYADGKDVVAKDLKVVLLEAKDKINDAADADAIATIVTQAKAAIDALVDEKAAADQAAAEQAAQAAADKAALDQALEDLGGQIDALTKTMEDNKAALQKAIADLNDDLDAFKEASEEEKAALQEQIDTKTQALQNALQALTDAAATKDELQAKIGELSGKITALENNSEGDKEELNGKIDELQNTLDALTDAAATKDDLQDEIDALTQRIITLEGANADAKTVDTNRNTVINNINAYVNDNLDQMLEADKLPTQVVALQMILVVKDATDQKDMDAAFQTVKDLVDANVAIKKATDEAKALKVSKLKAKSKKLKFTVSWKKNEKADGYQVQYKKSKATKFSNLKKSTTKLKVKSKKLKNKQKYIFRVRTFKTVNGKKVYGKWVKTKAVKCK